MKSTLVFVATLALLGTFSENLFAQLRAGAAVVDATPIQFPVFVNGGMTSRSLDFVTSKINVRAVVLDDGKTRLGIAVVDSCMMPRPFLDEVKQLASQRTGIRPDRMLISATHTHSAPASMSCLGTDADPTYVPYLREKIAEALANAEANLEPASWLGGSECCRLHRGPTLDSSSGSSGGRPVRQSYGASKHARRSKLG